LVGRRLLRQLKEAAERQLKATAERTSPQVIAFSLFALE
jgi:hypothetical protein